MIENVDGLLMSSRNGALVLDMDGLLIRLEWRSFNSVNVCMILMTRSLLCNRRGRNSFLKWLLMDAGVFYNDHVVTSADAVAAYVDD